LAAHDASPDRPMIAGVPVSTRGDDAVNMGANLVSAMFVSLATDIADPVERLLAVHESTKGAKEEYKAVGADALQNWTEFSGPRLFGLAVRLYSGMELASRHRPALNFLVSNVPGPPIPLYFAGGRLVSLFPMGPVMDGMGLNVTVLSYMDEIGFGFVACRELIPDLWELAEGVNAALAELTAAVAARQGPSTTTAPNSTSSTGATGATGATGETVGPRAAAAEATSEAAAKATSEAAAKATSEGAATPAAAKATAKGTKTASKKAVAKKPAGRPAAKKAPQPRKAPPNRDRPTGA
jgi:diacylglycerol O-acyltransferase / wax synthase